MTTPENTDRATDDSDRATNYEERARQSAMVTSRKPEGPKATGWCLYCGKPLVALGGLPRRWCDTECRNEWSSLNE